MVNVPLTMPTGNTIGPAVCFRRAKSLRKIDRRFKIRLDKAHFKNYIKTSLYV